MRILLVQSQSIPDIADTGSVIFPLGLIYVATALLNRKHDVRVYDTNTHSHSMQEIKKIVRDFEPDYIGLGLRNFDNADSRHYHCYESSFNELASELKRLAPSAKIVGGGAGFSLYAQKIMERSPALDYGVMTEGEITFPELIDNPENAESVKGLFYRNDSSVRFTGRREPMVFADSPPPNREIIDMEPYLRFRGAVGVQTKRGCKSHCSYCTYPYLQGADFRVRPVANVIDELEMLKKRYNLHDIYFADSVFNVPADYTRQLLQEMISRKLEIRWYSYHNMKYADAEYMKLARDSGCNCFEFSPDGFSRSALKSLNKGITKADIDRVYSVIKNNNNMDVVFNFIINSPGESFSNLLQIAWFLIKCKCFLRNKNKDTTFFRIRIYPNTQIYKTAVEKGMLSPGDDVFRPVFYDPQPMKFILSIFEPVAGKLINVPVVIFSLMRKVIRYFRLLRAKFRKPAARQIKKRIPELVSEKDAVDKALVNKR